MVTRRARILIARILILSSLLASGAAVAAGGFAPGVKVGTLGLGLEATYGLSERFNLRFGVNGLTFDFHTTTSGVRYDAEFDLGSSALLLDWHPFGGVFRLSFGYMHNNNVLRLTATPQRPQEIGGVPFQPDQIGTLFGEATYKENVPYFGLGWGNALREQGVGVNIDIGAMFQNGARVRLQSRGGQFSGNPMLEQALRIEEREAEEELEDFKIYPVISFGLSYRF